MLNKQEVRSSADQLIDGKVGVIPTDTVYGLVCRAVDRSAVERLYEIKKRQAKPGTLIAADIDQLVELGIKARYLKAVEDYWPGAISIVIPNHELEYLHLGRGSIAVRIPADKNLTELLKLTGPLLTTSANLPGDEPAETIQTARELLGDSVDFYVDGGDLSGNLASTIIRIVDDEVEVLRAGALKINDKGEIE